MKFFTIYFLLLFPFVFIGQNQQKINTKLSLLEKSEFLYQKSDYDSAYYYAKTSYDSFVKSSNDTLTINSLIQLLKIIEETHEEEQDYYFQLAKKKAIDGNNVKKLLDVYFTKGNNYYIKQDFVLAIPFFLKVDSLSKNFNIKNVTTVNAIINRAEISKLSFTRETTNMAHSLLYEALEQAKEINSLESIHLIYIHLSDINQMIRNFEDTKKYIDLALPYFKDQDNVIRVSRLLLIKTAYYLGVDSLGRANQTHLDRVAYLSTKENTYEMAKATFYYGNFLRRKLNNYSQAIPYLEEAKSLYQKVNKDSTDIYHRCIRDLAFCNLEQGNYKKASEYYRDAYNLKITLLEKFNRNSSKILEAKYQTERKEQEISLLQLKNGLVEQQKTNQRNQLLGGIGFTSVAGLFFFFMYRNRQKTTNKLQELDKAKSNFFANISHEFRTPLTLILGPIQKQLQKESLPDDERDNFEMMHRNSTRLLSLVDQLLDISKIEAGSLKLKVTEKELIPFIGSLADGFTYAAEQKELNYSINNNPTTNSTWFDKDVLEKIITNLLSNAIKYTPTKGSIVCDALVKENQFYLEVKNTGKGLSAEELTKVFERFYQLNENKQGVGIGLALVKELVHLHRGTITVESFPDKWTTFKVVIPIHREVFKEVELADVAVIKSTNEEPISQEDIGEITKINVVTDVSKDPDNHQDLDNPILLMVDDNADIRTYVSTIFKDTYTILTAKNGQEGIDLAIEHIPDIIISDIMMPVKNGIELCNTVKVDERTSHIPIILLTAKAGEENEIEGVKTGADDYVTKPFNEELLKLRVQKLIESRKKLQERYSQEVVLRSKDIAITSVDEQFLQRLQKVLDDKLVESSFSIENFSKAVGMSRMQLHRKLKALTGLSATEFIRSQRLKLAAQLLKKSEINVSQVGYSVGFNDHAYFSKCFKEMYHCTPSEFVKTIK